jgi:hypothetical protein
MADARPVCGIDAWPAVGLTLGEIIARLVGPDGWDLLTAIVGDRPPPGKSSPTSLPLVADIIEQWSNDPNIVAALRACLPLLDEWNAKRVTVKGRRGGALEPAVDLPPPATGWRVVIHSLIRSVIFEPGSGGTKLIYDVLFFPATMAAARREPGYYATIREIAAQSFPDGVDRVRPAVVVQTIADELKRRNQPAPSRDTILRAVRHRK